MSDDATGLAGNSTRRVLSRGTNGLEESRSRRTQSSVLLRRAKKEENINKKRQQVDPTFQHQQQQPSYVPNDVDGIAEMCSDANLSHVCSHPNHLDQWLKSAIAILSTSERFAPQLVLVIRFIRRYLSRPKVLNIDMVAQSEVVGLLIARLPESPQECLETDNPSIPVIMFESAWALTNIASSEYTSHVVNNNAIPRLVNLLSSFRVDAREQSAWCLGNIAGDNTNFRDQVVLEKAVVPMISNILECLSVITSSAISMMPTIPEAEPYVGQEFLLIPRKVLAIISANLEHHANIQPYIPLLRNTVWALSNMSRGKPGVSLNLIAGAIPVLVEVVANAVDGASVTDALWALSYITDGNSKRVEAVLNQSLGGTLNPNAAPGGSHDVIRCLLATIDNSPELTAVIPAVRTLGNIVSGTDEQTDRVVDAGAIGVLSRLLMVNGLRKTARKDICWVFSNIAAGTPQQRRAILADPFALSTIVKCLLEDIATAREASWAIDNLLVSPNDPESAQFLNEAVQTLVRYQFVEIVGSQPNMKDEKFQSNLVHSLAIVFENLSIINPIEARRLFRNAGIPAYLAAEPEVRSEAAVAAMNALNWNILDDGQLDVKDACLPVFEDQSTWNDPFVFSIKRRH